MMRTTHLSLTCVVVAVLLAACGGSSAETTTTTAAEATSTTAVTSTSAEATSTTAAGSTGVPATTATTTTTTATTSSTTTTTVPPTTEDPAARVTVIAVEWANGELVGEEEYEVARDAVVEIIVTADVSDEIHVHGYDVFADVGPGEPGSVTFTASIPGIFEVEFEGSGLLLFDLIVS